MHIEKRSQHPFLKPTPQVGGERISRVNRSSGSENEGFHGRLENTIGLLRLLLGAHAGFVMNSAALSTARGCSHRLPAIICAACWRLVSVTFGAAQHAGDFVGAGAVVEDADAGLRAAVLLALFDGEMLIGEGGDLRQVGDAEDLLRAAEGFELLADGFGGAAADADVDFVEDQGARGGFLSWSWTRILRLRLSGPA